MADELMDDKDKKVRDGELMPRELAAAELLKWAEAMDLETEGPFWDARIQHRGRLVKAIARGELVVSADGETLEYTPKRSKKAADVLTFSPPDGTAQLEWDKHLPTQSVHRTYAFMAAMTGKPIQHFSKMDDRDLRLCDSIIELYLGS